MREQAQVLLGAYHRRQPGQRNSHHQPNPQKTIQKPALFSVVCYLRISSIEPHTLTGGNIA
ncbi:MAG: hypothetical protein CV087_22570 [Candidatus Brocadia sp. WS118]|nr:MAG: hypothetical protein CV087_22570 [Candidatus Brocadia sp. WS118]